MKVAPTTTLSTEKLNGRFYTPEFIVDNILDISSYHGRAILKKHAIDNSCGDGAFLVAIVNRYCKEFLKYSSDLQILNDELSTYIHGIEIDEGECNKCIKNLNETVKQFGLSYVKWDVICADTLNVTKFNGKMDFVLGNPPYVRVHNLGDSFDEIKKFSFAQNGMTDLFIVFYEIGIKMLNATGILGYITPSSFFNSLAGKSLRQFLVNNNLMDRVVDLKHFQAFHATTYSTIIILRNNRNISTTEYYRFDEKNNFPYYIDTLNKSDYYINDCFYFSTIKTLKELKNILLFRTTREHFSVKNGFATLADSFFIGQFDFDDFTISVIKASTGKQYKCIFPYSGGKLVSYSKLTENPSVKTYFETHRTVLLNRSLENRDDWYGFGRSQGINDVYRRKYAINALIRTPVDLKILECNVGVGVYSGLYILTEISEMQLRELLLTEDFVEYVSLLGKYKSGGYYTFSSRDLKNYLEYKYSQKYGIKGEGYEQYSIFGNP